MAMVVRALDKRAKYVHKKTLRLVEDWKKSLDDGKLVAIVAIALSKAFNSLPESLLISKLREYGLEHN